MFRGLCSLLLVTGVAFSAGAQPAAPAPASRPAPAPAPPGGARVHDGFFFRAATGFGVYEESLVTNEENDYGGDVEGHTVGLASLGEVALGGTIGRGFVLGGGAYTAQLVSGHFKLGSDSEGTPPSELDPELRTLAVFGPFLDWYPNPAKGFHVEAALGFAAITSTSGGSRGFEEPEYQAVGGGLVFGGGYEWFIDDEWSIGVLGRLMAAVVSGEDDADVRWVHGISTTPSLLVGVTYH